MISVATLLCGILLGMSIRIAGAELRVRRYRRDAQEWAHRARVAAPVEVRATMGETL